MTILPETKFYIFHHMTNPNIPEDYEGPAWVELPARLYDRETWYKLSQRYIAEMVLAEQLGFDGLVVNEHHASAFTINSDPTIMAASLIARTERVKICVWGTPPVFDLPHRLAETYATLDVLSHGRLEVAIPLGTPMDYYANPINPVTGRERLQEALDIILRGWTEDEPFRYEGKYYNYKNVNIWPKPYQQPHPKIYMVGTGSPETIEIAAQRGFGYASAFNSIAIQNACVKQLRERAPVYGNTMRPDQFPLLIMVNITDDEEEAIADYEPHIRYHFAVAGRVGRYANAPGYMSIDSFRKRAGNAVPRTLGGFNWEELATQFRVVAGTPATVIRKVEEWAQELGSNLVVFHPHCGNMPHWKVVRNMTKLADEVLPVLRERQFEAAATRAAAE